MEQAIVFGGTVLFCGLVIQVKKICRQMAGGSRVSVARRG